MKKRNYIVAGVMLTCCCLLVACPPSKSQEVSKPALAYDSVNGRFLSVYVKTKSEQNGHLNRTDKSRLYGSFINSDGSLLGSEFVIAQNSFEYYCPSVVFDATVAKYLVVWNAGNFLYGQFVSANGSSSGARVILSNTASAFFGRCSSVSYDSANEKYLAAWGEQNFSENDSIYAQLINVDGSLDGPKLAVSNNGAYPAYPAIVYDSVSHRFLIVWDSPAQAQVKGRMINPDGTFVASEFAISSATGSYFLPRASYNSVDAGFLVTWEETSAGKRDLKGQLLHADGTAFQLAFGISSTTRNVIGHEAVFNPSNQTYLVVFGDISKNKALLYSQVVTSLGALDTTVANDNILISNVDYPGDSNPTAAYDSVNNRYFSSWKYGSIGAQFGDIHGRLVGADGSPAGTISVLSNGGLW